MNAATVKVGVNNGPICLHNGPLVWVKLPFNPGLLTNIMKSFLGIKVESDFSIGIFHRNQNMHAPLAIVNGQIRYSIGILG